MVAAYSDVVAPLGRDDAMVTWTKVKAQFTPLVPMTALQRITPIRIAKTRIKASKHRLINTSTNDRTNEYSMPELPSNV